MKLRPLAHLDLRREKAFKHYYGAHERWWELSKQPEADWRQDRSCLDDKVAPAAEREDLRDGIVCNEAARVLDDGHARWFRTTERECDGAEERRHPEPGRKYLISQHGVVVVVVPTQQENILVTAFRPDPLTPEGHDFGGACAYLKRFAIRRAQRRTSYKK